MAWTGQGEPRSKGGLPFFQDGLQGVQGHAGGAVRVGRVHPGGAASQSPVGEELDPGQVEVPPPTRGPPPPGAPGKGPPEPHRKLQPQSPVQGLRRLVAHDVDRGVPPAGEVPKAPLQVLGGGWGKVRENQLLRPFQEEVRNAILAPEEGPALRGLGFCGKPRPLRCHAVDPGDVVVPALEEDGVFRGHPVQEAWGRGLGEEEALALEPSPPGQGLGPFRHLQGHLLRVLQAREVQAPKGHAPVEGGGRGRPAGPG
jgi:hypothetical protein